MNLKEIHIKDFMSMGEVDIDFQDGIISVNGINKDVIGATSNGSGKSVLFDAIVWALYGKTIRPIGSDDVIRRGKDVASVTLFFQKAEDVYCVERSRGTKANLQVFISQADQEPTEITQGTPSITQGKLDAIIGMDFKTFLSVATFDLDALRFARATDKEQKEILERLLNLDLYNIALEKTRKEITGKEKELVAATTSKEFLVKGEKGTVIELDRHHMGLAQYHEVVGVEGRDTEIAIKQLVDNCAVLEKDRLDYKQLIVDTSANTITIDNNLIATKKLAIADCEAQMLAIDKIIDNLRMTLNEYSIDPKINAALVPAKAVLIKLEAQLKNTQTNRITIEKQIQLVESKLNQPCGECKRPITENEVGSVLENYASEVLRLMEIEAGIKSEYVNREIEYNNIYEAYTVEYQKVIDSANNRKEVNGRIMDYLTQTAKLRGDSRKYEAEITIEENRARKEAQDKIASYNAFISTKQNQIKQFETQIAQKKHAYELLQSREGQYHQSIDSCQERLKIAKESIAAEEIKVQALTNDIAYLKYWEKAFGYSGIRAVLLDDVAAKLTENANKYLQEIIGGSLWVNISTQSTNKDGERKEKMDVQVFNSFGAGNYYGCSKGEMQRIDIAISLALHDIAQTRSASPVSFIIMDEIFERLDGAGCDAIIRLLHKERQNVGMIFIVSHNPELSIRFPKKIQFEKVNGVTSLVKVEPVNIISEKITEEVPKKRGRPKKAISI